MSLTITLGEATLTHLSWNPISFLLTAIPINPVKHSNQMKISQQVFILLHNGKCIKAYKAP